MINSKFFEESIVFCHTTWPSSCPDYYLLNRSRSSQHFLKGLILFLITQLLSLL